jgi:hypothetical protein
MLPVADVVGGSVEFFTVGVPVAGRAIRDFPFYRLCHISVGLFLFG